MTSLHHPIPGVRYGADSKITVGDGAVIPLDMPAPNWPPARPLDWQQPTATPPGRDLVWLPQEQWLVDVTREKPGTGMPNENQSQQYFREGE